MEKSNVFDYLRKKKWCLIFWFSCFPLFGFKGPSYQDSVQNCRSLSQKGLRQELLSISRSTFSQSKIDFQALVGHQWTLLEMDALVRSLVEKATQKASSEYSYFERIKSSFSKRRAKEMATKIAHYAFSNPEFIHALKQLSQKIASQLNERVHTQAKLSINRSIECVNQFLKSKYNDLVKKIFHNQLVSSFEKILEPTEQQKHSFPSLVKQRSKSLLGVGLIVSRQIARLIAKRIAKRLTARLAKSLGMRVVSRIGAKFIPWIGWGLLAWDVWDIAQAKGALPGIEKALKSQKVRDKMKAEIAESIQVSFESNYPQIIRQVADSVFSIWAQFQAKFKQVLDLSDRNTVFKEWFQKLKTTQHLYTVVNLYSILGETKLLSLINEKRSQIFIHHQHAPQLIVLLRYFQNAEQTIAWAKKAGRSLPIVVESEMYKHKKAEELTPEIISIILDTMKTKDRSKLALLSNKEIASFIGVNRQVRQTLIQRLSSRQLRMISKYLRTLKGEKRNEMITLFLSPSAKEMNLLENAAITNFLSKSNSKFELLKFFLRNQPLKDLEQFETIPIEAYFLKYGKWAYYALGVCLFFCVPFILVLLIWIFRLTMGGYILLFRVLRRSRR